MTTTPVALLRRATLTPGILRDLVRLQAHGLTAPRAVTGWLVTRLHVDLVALGRVRTRWEEPPPV